MSNINESFSLKTAKYQAKQALRDAKTSIRGLIEYTKFMVKSIFANNDKYNISILSRQEGDKMFVGLKNNDDGKVYTIIEVDGPTKTAKVFRNQINNLGKEIGKPVNPMYLNKIANKFAGTGYKCIDTNRIDYRF